MKKKLLIVAVVVLSLVLALVVGAAIWLEIDRANQVQQPTDPIGTTTEATEGVTTAPTTEPDGSVGVDTTPVDTTPTDTTPANTDPAATTPVTTVPKETEPEETYTWPRDELEDITTPPTTATDPSEPTTPTTQPPEPTSGNPGGMGGPNEGELDPIL